MLVNTAVKSIKRKSHRGDQAVTTDQITLDVLACLSEAIRDVSKLLPKRYWHKQGTALSLVVGVAGTPAAYSLASDVQEPILFHYTSGGALYNLVKVDSDAEWFKKIWSPAAAVGKPMYYRELGPDASGYKRIEVFPIPDGSYSLSNEYYKVKGADLTTSDLQVEIPNIPDHVQDAVEKGGLYYFLKGFDDPLQAVAKVDYNEAKEAMNQSDEADQDANLRMRWDVQGPSPFNSVRFT